VGQHRQLASVLLAIASILATLALVEVVFRVLAFRADERALLATTRAAPPPPGSTVRMGQILRPSLDRRIVFELIPELSVTFLGASLVTDERGFRTGPRPAPSGGAPVRIVGLGDSVMFGWGVSGSECFLSWLVAELGRQHPEVAWTALNTAVPGYNTAMEVQTLRVKALEPPPHLVLLNFVGNDLRLPNFVLERRRYFSPRRSFLVDFVLSRLREDEADLSPHLSYLPRQERPSEAERVAARYRDLVGKDAFHGALDDLAGLAVLHRFAVVVLAHPEVPGFVRRAAEERSFLVVQTGERVRELAVELGLDGAWKPPLSLTPADPHPSALGHELIGRALLEALEGAGLPARLAERVLREQEASASP
jgi:lysophospholipase L1-like esterase